MIKKRFNPSSIGLTIFDLNEQIKGKIILMDAPYQRGIVWDLNMKRMFIQSIMVGIIPNALIFNNLYDEKEQRTTKVCIDGKQRLTSIVEFMNGNFSVSLDGVEFNYLSGMIGKAKADFSGTKMFVVEYTNLSYDMELAIFRRIQNGKPLSTGELVKCHIESGELTIMMKNFVNTIRTEITKFIRLGRTEEIIAFASRLMYICNMETRFRDYKVICRYISKLNTNDLMRQHTVKVMSIIKKIKNEIEDNRFPTLNYFQFSIMIGGLSKIDIINKDNLIVLGIAIAKIETKTIKDINKILSLVVKHML